MFGEKFYGRNCIEKLKEICTRQVWHLNGKSVFRVIRVYTIPNQIILRHNGLWNTLGYVLFSKKRCPRVDLNILLFYLDIRDCVILYHVFNSNSHFASTMIVIRQNINWLLTPIGKLRSRWRNGYRGIVRKSADYQTK